MVKVKVVFGQIPNAYMDDIISAVHNSEEENPEIDQYEVGARFLLDECMDGDSFSISEYEFKTDAEADAFLYGVSEGEGWMAWSGRLEGEELKVLEKVLEAKEKIKS